MTTVPLSNEERQKLEKNMKRAEEFERKEELDLMRQPLEGQLLKFTNAFQGWLPRWFVLDPQTGEFIYFLKEEHKHAHKQRGSLLLAGAVISPSDEDSLAFGISPMSGEGYKLKAADTRQRQVLLVVHNVPRGADHEHLGVGDGFSRPNPPPQV